MFVVIHVEGRQRARMRWRHHLGSLKQTGRETLIKHSASWPGSRDYSIHQSLFRNLPLFLERSAEIIIRKMPK